MDQTVLRIEDNMEIADRIYKLTLSGDMEEPRPGQFVNIKVPGTFLRRPLSVCSFKGGLLTLCYKIVGEGTEILAECRPGQRLDVLTGLGNGYDINCAGESPVLIGGGMGSAPLLYLAEKLRKIYASLDVVLGFNSKTDVILLKELENTGFSIHVATVDGSLGNQGFATDILPEKYSYFYSCGPLPMLKAVYKKCETSGQMSLEERMGCGFGACMGCSIKTKEGYKRVCKDGPVFKKEELSWED